VIEVNRRRAWAQQPLRVNGMGMGLCIAHAIMEARGGKISAESRPSGAVFHVILPLAPT
jgi:signal transduction histidine kinase